jgi:hypothetical protein
MSSKFLCPNWNNLSRKEQDLFEAWLQSLILFLRNHIELRNTFTNQIIELANSDDSDIENFLLNIEKPIIIDTIDSVSDDNELSIETLFQLGAKLPDRIPDAICDVICGIAPQSEACKNCRS